MVVLHHGASVLGDDPQHAYYYLSPVYTEKEGLAILGTTTWDSGMQSVYT